MEPVEISEQIEFDVNAFLDSIPRSPTKQEPQCPRCLVDMAFGSIQHKMELYLTITAALKRFNTKCYVTSSKENLAAYLKAVEKQTHPCYAKIAPESVNAICQWL